MFTLGHYLYRLTLCKISKNGCESVVQMRCERRLDYLFDLVLTEKYFAHSNAQQYNRDLYERTIRAFMFVME